jgi:hypothetical protein
MNADERQRIFNFDDWDRWAPGRFAPIARGKGCQSGSKISVMCKSSLRVQESAPADVI